MWKEIKECYYAKSWRMFLVDVALVCFIVATVAFTRVQFLQADEAHQLRLDFDSHAASTTTALQMGTSQLSSDLNDLNVNAKVITSRMDSQITELKALLRTTAKQSQVSSQQEMKTTRDAIKDSINDTNHVLQTVADQTSDVAAVVAKPVQVNVQPSKSGDKPPVVTVQVPSATPPKQHKRSGWGKFWHAVFFLKD